MTNPSIVVDDDARISCGVSNDLHVNSIYRGPGALFTIGTLSLLLTTSQRFLLEADLEPYDPKENILTSNGFGLP